MMVTDIRCWWQNHSVDDFFSLRWWFSQRIQSVTNILNRSPTFQTCHQHIWSPISVTNIDVTIQLPITMPTQNWNRPLFLVPSLCEPIGQSAKDHELRNKNPPDPFRILPTRHSSEHFIRTQVADWGVPWCTKHSFEISICTKVVVCTREKLWKLV